MLIKAAEAAIKDIHRQYRYKPGERNQLSLMAHAIGSLPEVRRIVCGFSDRKKYPDRPTILLHDAHPQVWLLGWREGDWTDIHDHGATQVGIYTIQGVVTEDIYAARKSYKKDKRIMLDFSRNLRQGDLATCTRNYIHRVGNMFPEPAATLHCYGPSLDDMNLYRLDGDMLKHNGEWHKEHHAQH